MHFSYFYLHWVRNFNEIQGITSQPGSKYTQLSHVLFGQSPDISWSTPQGLIMVPVLNILQSHFCLAGALKHYAAQTRDPEPQSLMVVLGRLFESAQNIFWISLPLGLNILRSPLGCLLSESFSVLLSSSHIFSFLLIQACIRRWIIITSAR